MSRHAVKNPKLARLARLCQKAIDIGYELGLDVTAVAVDASGDLAVVLRSDLASFASLEPARKKAVTAAALRMSTDGIMRLMGKDPVAMAALAADPRMLVVPGGHPIIMEGDCIGGLGISGGHYAQDEAIALRTLAREPLPPFDLSTVKMPPGL